MHVRGHLFLKYGDQENTAKTKYAWFRARNELGRVFSNVVWILAFCATFRPRSGKVRYLQLT